MIAVGTAIAGRPPHRSVREELPHTAPPLSDDGRDEASLHAVHAPSLTAWSGAVSGPIAKRTQLLFGDPLPSIDSAAGVPVLFANFVGTTRSSDFPETCISAVPPEAFSDRSTIALLQAIVEISGISRFSRLKFLRMLRFFDSAEPFHRLP
jgi:hypothetical protein